MALDANDRLDLLDLSARYAHAFDSVDIEAFAALFTEDASFFLPDSTCVSGPDNLRRWAAERSASAPNMRHLILNILVEEAEGGARGRAYFYALRLDDPLFRVRNFGRYEDEYTRTAGGWRFKSRRVVGELPSELVDAPFMFGPA